MRIRGVATAALIALLACNQVQARTLDQVPPYLEKEGKFVSYPAVGMGAFGAVVGTVLALPAVLVAAPIGWAAGDPLGYAMVPPSVVATGGAEIGYHVGGALPWLLKNAFYDAPMTAVARIKGEPASGLVAQVEPPPVINGDIQYLDTTPPAARVPVVLARQYSSALPPPKPPTSLMLRRQLSPFKPPALPVKGAAAASKLAPAVRPAPVPPVVAPSAAVVPPPAAPAVEPVQPPPPPAEAALPVAPPPVVDSFVEPAAPPVAEAPPVAAPPPVAVAPIMSDAAPVADEPPVAEAPPATEASGEAAEDKDSRPALKKKRKFSERFGF